MRWIEMESYHPSPFSVIENPKNPNFIVYVDLHQNLRTRVVLEKFCPEISNYTAKMVNEEFSKSVGHEMRNSSH